MKSTCCNQPIRKVQYGTICSECLLTCKRRFPYRLLIITSLMTTLLLVSSKEHSVSLKYFSRLTIHEDTTDILLNDNSILKELIADSCILPGVALAQAKLESNWFRSPKTFRCHNIFGIKPHKCKYVTGEYNYQATFNSYRDCIACYCYIQKSYLSAIDGHYAQNSNYINTLKQFK